MLLNNRVILKKSSTLTDLTLTANDILVGSDTLNIVAATDALYLGSDLPFNHRYFEIGTANDQNSSVAVSLWNGSSWVSAVDKVDQTSSSSKTLAQSGVISWVPNRSQGSWIRQYSTEQMSDLNALTIYDLYWVRLTFSADLKASTSLKYVGYRFSSDLELTNQYPELSNSGFMTAFKAGKTDWTEQTISAADYILQDLRAMGVITSPNQILDWRNSNLASVHKTAEIIFRGLGNAYKDKMEAARSAYKASLQVKVYNVDLNSNAQLDDREKTPVMEMLAR